MHALHRNHTPQPPQHGVDPPLGTRKRHGIGQRPPQPPPVHAPPGAAAAAAAGDAVAANATVVNAAAVAAAEAAANEASASAALSRILPANSGRARKKQTENATKASVSTLSTASGATGFSGVEEQGQGQRGGTGPGGSLQVLIVEDSLPIMKVMTMNLQRAKHSVDQAVNGALGLEKMKQSAAYDVVLMDLQVSGGQLASLL